MPFDASGVSIDTRTIQRGDLFIALVSGSGDGHDHAAHAIAAGAAGVMVHRDMPEIANRLVVDDTLAALTRLGAFARARFSRTQSGRAVAVTGSVGKTTTKEMLRLALSAFGPAHAAVASYNNHWGVPLTLARIPSDAAFCVVEIGMNHAGEIAPLARLARPDVAVVTAVEAAHIGHLGGIEAIADEKAAIMDGLEPAGVAVLPADSPWLPRLTERAGAHRVLTFGASRRAGVRLTRIEQDAAGSNLAVAIEGRLLHMRLHAPGRHMAINAMATLATVVALGFEPAAAAHALERFVPLQGRGAHRHLTLSGGRALLLDESYNANAASMRAALDVLRLQPALRRVAILGDMLELGEFGPTEHAALAEAVARSADILFACGPLMRHLFDTVPPALRGAHAADAAALAPSVAAYVAAGDAILVKGSLGSRMRTIVAAIDALAIPNVTAVQAIPVVLAIPEVAATLDVPAISGVPAIPDVAATLDVPAISGVPATPDVAATLAAPAVPGVPAIPDVAATLDVPAVPGVPAIPGTPSIGDALVASAERRAR
jgi:UDP-N-acetylmuramoyl-tripeptide--D-alanyl-D-alanine ligase